MPGGIDAGCESVPDSVLKGNRADDRISSCMNAVKSVEAVLHKDDFSWRLDSTFSSMCVLRIWN